MDAEMSLYARIKKMANLLDREVAKRNIENKLDADNITSPIQGRIIFYLFSETRKRDVPQKDIETYFGIRASTATGILKRMEGDRLIVREISRADERVKYVKLTQKAIVLYPKAISGLEETDKQLTKGLTKQDMKIFNRVLDTITENATAK